LFWIRILAFFDVGAFNEKSAIYFLNDRMHVSLDVDHFPHHIPYLRIDADSIIEEDSSAGVCNLISTLTNFENSPT